MIPDGRDERSRTDGRARSCVLGAVILAAFIASRTLLVSTSFDAVYNWEEPVFLYSALELRAHGITNVLDHQDDLSHGGSVPLLLLAMPWTALFGTSLEALKGVAILWAALTLVALMVVGARLVSVPFGLVVGLLWAGLSPHDAALHTTLVGSHPESILFMTLATGAYLDSRRHSDADLFRTLAVGVAGGLALWCSYLTAPLVAALVAAKAWTHRGARTLGALATGLVIGASPWILQNLWLRPHGAGQWTARIDHFHSVTAHAWGVTESATRVVESFGLGRVPGTIALAVLAFLGALALSTHARPAGRGTTSYAALPVATAIVGTFVALWLAMPARVPGEGYYYARFFVPLHFELYWLSALGIERLRTTVDRRVWVIAAAAILAVWIIGHARLYGTGNDYVADERRDYLAGCTVFGHAELDRARTAEVAVSRLEAISDSECATRALVGYGWAVVSRYTRRLDMDAFSQAIEAAAPGGRLAPVCAGARQMLDGYYEDAMDEDARTAAAYRLEALCATHTSHRL
jgi:hypothetical protein